MFSYFTVGILLFFIMRFCYVRELYRQIRKSSPPKSYLQKTTYLHNVFNLCLIPRGQLLFLLHKWTRNSFVREHMRKSYKSIVMMKENDDFHSFLEINNQIIYISQFDLRKYFLERERAILTKVFDSINIFDSIIQRMESDSNEISELHNKILSIYCVDESKIKFIHIERRKVDEVIF